MAAATLSDLMLAIERGETVVLPNARAARQLRSTFSAWQRQHGVELSTPAKVLSWQQWMQSQWSDLVVAGAEQRLLLNAVQERSLWAEVLSKGASDRWLSSVDALAELAMSSWQLAASYRATHLLNDPGGHTDSRAFARWSEHFSQLCTERECLSSALLETALIQHLETGSMRAPRSVLLTGFIERLPDREALLEGMRRKGTHVVESQLDAGTDEAIDRASIMAGSEREELFLAGRWIRKFLETSIAEGRSPRVAILMPNLRDDRQELEGILRETLAPELQWIGADLSSAPWEISSGVMLTSVPMVADALLLARWTEAPLPMNDVSSLLLSPYFGRLGADVEDRDASAELDAERLRRMLVLQPEISFGSVLRLIKAGTHTDAGDVRGWSRATAWLRRLEDFLHTSKERSKERSRNRSFAEWMEHLRSLLRSSGWPGARPLDAVEMETVHAWESLLDMVSTLDFTGDRVSFADALHALTEQARRTAFSPPSKDAPVQVMSPTEAEGSIFDAVVFMRCTDSNWPLTERMDPLLPWGLQHRLKMPGTHPARSTQRSRAFAEDLSKRAASLLFTFAAEAESGALRPSPLLKELGIQQHSLAASALHDVEAEPVMMEEYPDHVGLPPLPSSTVEGGAAVLKLQAACGFLAFAELRLHAAEPQIADLGFDERENGRWLHRALQHFWTEAGSQENLLHLDDARRERLLETAIEAAVPRNLQLRDDWDRSYLALQKLRMRSILQRWIQEELRRGPFTVLATEQKETISIGPLVLTVRMDRIDKVEDGFFLVDYKTGHAANPAHWDGDRPDEPQLPLYALNFEPEEVKGLAFAKVRAGREMKWTGYHAREGILPGAKVKDLPPLIEQWRSSLERLAEDFAAGKAHVHPKNMEINCKRCAQRLLCRVDSLTMHTGMTESEEGQDVDG